MDAAAYLAALQVERRSVAERGLSTADVDAEIARVSGKPVVETAAVSPAVEVAAVKRGRPRRTPEE
ncbi:hypothetical protein EBZ38_12485 [bacterium]|nr:hypothetical protein [bacterium]NDC95360.1 hypothetical protein [bacterium]NDD85073.1 hypothetical protein [bacterium]NDG19176.1 hypothetical protein [Betaproteobacteria bacterium]